MMCLRRGWWLWRWKSLVILKDILSWHDFPLPSPLSLSLFLFWLSFLGEESSLCSCQGYVLWRMYVPQMVFGFLVKSHWTAPCPQGFLDLVKQWPLINNNMLFINNLLIVFPSKHWLAIASFTTSTNLNEVSEGWRQGFLSQFYFELRHTWDLTKKEC